MKVEKENGKSSGMVSGRDRKVWQFLSNVFWKNIGCIVSDPTFGFGGSRMWDKEEVQNVSGNKRKRCSVREKVNLY